MMPLPETIPVKLSSEDAGAISLTRVVTQQMGLRDLFGTIVTITGKDAERIQRILHAGTFLEGGTRYRWSGLDASAQQIQQQLAAFPDPDPTRRFSERDAIAATLREASGRTVRLPREAAVKRRLLRRKRFWDVLVDLAQQREPRYVTYSYREGADLYSLELSENEPAVIRESAALLPHSALVKQLERCIFSSVEFLVRR